MADFFVGVIITLIVLFMGVKLNKLKIEYGDFKEDKPNADADPGRPDKPSDKLSNK